MLAHRFAHARPLLANFVRPAPYTKRIIPSRSAAERHLHGTVTSMAADDIFWMGLETLKISRSSLHGKLRARLLDRLRAALAGPDSGAAAAGGGKPAGSVLLQAGGPFHLFSGDMELVFRQEPYFHYLFGVQDEGWYGSIDIASGRTTLFMPRLPASYAVWMGELKPPSFYQAKYAVDEVHYVDEMAGVLKAQTGPLHVLQGTNTDSGRQVEPPSFEGSEAFEFDTSKLFDVLTECRATKSEEEIAIIRYCNDIGSRGHVEMMRTAKAGMMEYQLENVFLSYCYHHGGCRLSGYTPIAASGANGAVLHYGHAGAPNDRQICDGELLLMDMGCEYYRYGSDITTTWPVGGKFSPPQKMVYEAVLAAQQAVLGAMKPGVAWPDMHDLAYRTLLSALLAGGLLQGGSVQELMDADVGALFMPHGLGHFLGLDVHDVGGYPQGGPARIQRPGFRSLRTARILQPGMVITVEPGCYFNAALLEPAFKDPAVARFLNEPAIRPLMSLGGVRIEDNVVITADGAASLTNVPRTVKDIEAVMAGAPWPPQ